MIGLQELPSQGHQALHYLIKTVELLVIYQEDLQHVLEQVQLDMMVMDVSELHGMEAEHPQRE